MSTSSRLALVAAVLLVGCDDPVGQPAGSPGWPGTPASTVSDEVRVLAAEVALLREQPALAEMFLREVADPTPWSSLPGWAAAAAELRGRPVRQALQMRHDGPVDGFAVTPDGRHVATVAREGRVRVWTIAGDTATSVDLPGARGQFTAIAISDDGSRVVGGGGGIGRFDEGAPVWLWSVAGGLIGELRGHQDAVLELAFRPDGQAAATSSMDGTVRVWDAATAAELAVFRVAPSMFPEMPPGGPSMMAAVSGLAWRPDGQRIATGDHTGAVFEWMVGQERPTTTLRGHTDDVSVLRYSADGSRLVSGSRDNTARVWDPAAGTLLHTFTFEHTIDDATFSPDGQFLATLAYAGDARVWHLETGRPTKLEGSRWPRSVSFSPDGAYIVTADNQVGLLWRGHGAAGLGVLRGHEGELAGARFTADGRIVTASRDGSVRVWQVDRGTRGAGDKRPFARAFSPDGVRRLEGGFREEETRELEGSRPLWSMALGEIKAAAYSPDGATITVATEDDELVRLRARTGEILRRWRPESLLGTPQALAIRGDGALAAATLSAVVVWDTEGREIAARRGDPMRWGETEYTALAWSPDGARLALATRADEVLLWRPGQAAPDGFVSLVDALGDVHDHLELLAWSPDGARLAVGSGAGVVAEFDVASRRPLARWRIDPLGDDGLRYGSSGARLHAINVGGEPIELPAIRDPAELIAALWQTNRACPTPTERERWLHLDEVTAAADHARCAALLACVVGGAAPATCVR
jgi:WD40 repeat protein